MTFPVAVPRRLSLFDGSILSRSKRVNDFEATDHATTVFEFGGLRDRQRDYIEWVLKSSVEEGVAPEDIMTGAAATRLAAKLKTPLQIGQHLVRAFEAGFEVGAKPVDETVVEAVLSLRIDDLEPRLTRSGYDVRSLVEQFDAKPAEIRRLPGPTQGYNWKCPYCGHAQVILQGRLQVIDGGIPVAGWGQGRPGFSLEATVCANSECQHLSLDVALHTGDYVGNTFLKRAKVAAWSLLPSSCAKPQPDCVPEPLRLDYEEACAIRDLSPKASATLIRRCMQGTIRDFCGISEARLIDEIRVLRKRIDEGKAPPGVQADTVDAIDHVRKIGNIGAHMENDINVIVDVDPNEAQILIELAETLFEEWYVARQVRTARLAKLGVIASDKKQLQQQKSLPAPGS
jgi:hypothetical protein